MLLFDAHLDLSLNALSWNRDLTQPLADIREREKGKTDIKARGTGTVCLPEMRAAEIGICIATQIGHSVSKHSPLYGWNSPELAWAQTQGQLAWYRSMEEQGIMRQITTASVLDQHIKAYNESPDNTPLGYILSLEGADSLLTLEYLERAYNYGLRAVGPAHYGPGRYAPGTGESGPLEPRGRELLKAMDKLGMALDVTHLTDEGMDEALDLFQGTVWASHSNCRSIIPGQRQLSDHQIKRLIERDAVIGVALDAWMLYPDWIKGTTTPEETGVMLDSVADHIDYVCQMAGTTRHSGVGSDLDGGFGTEQCPKDLNTIKDLQRVAGILEGRGYSEDDIAGIMHGNWLRIVRTVLGE